MDLGDWGKCRSIFHGKYGFWWWPGKMVLLGQLGHQCLDYLAFLLAEWMGHDWRKLTISGQTSLMIACKKFMKILCKSYENPFKKFYLTHVNPMNNRLGREPGKPGWTEQKTPLQWLQVCEQRLSSWQPFRLQWHLGNTCGKHLGFPILMWLMWEYDDAVFLIETFSTGIYYCIVGFAWCNCRSRGTMFVMTLSHGEDWDKGFSHQIARYWIANLWP